MIIKMTEVNENAIMEITKTLALEHGARASVLYVLVEGDSGYSMLIGLADKNCCELEVICDLSQNRGDAIAILKILAEGGVTPTSAREVVSDLL